MYDLQGAPSELQDWTGETIYCFPPRSLYRQTILKLHETDDIKAAALFLMNREMNVERLWVEQTTGHLPDYVQQCSLHIIQVRSHQLLTKFTESWHRMIWIFIDKNVVNSDLSSRCLKAPGLCDLCQGNRYMIPRRSRYTEEVPLDSDFINRIF